MKKLKIFLMMAVLSVVLCACGGKEAEQSAGSDNKGNAVAEQTTKDESTKEEKTDKNSKLYECLPEVLEAEPSDRLMQYEDIVFKRDMSMSLLDVLEALQKGGDEYKFYTGDYITGAKEELSLDGMIKAGGAEAVAVAREDGCGFLLEVNNTTEELAKLNDDAVKVNMFIPMGDVDIYLCNGIPFDGEGLTYESVKEVMADYADSLVEEDYSNNYWLNYEYQWTTPEGEIRDGKISFIIDLATGDCLGVGDS